jgi:predicted dehydrogenase
MKKNIALLLNLLCMITLSAFAQDNQPLRLGVAGLSHGHVWEVIRRVDRGDFVVVGVAESNDSLRANNRLRGKIADNLFYADLETMLTETKPEAVIVYEPIFDHLRVVEACAPKGIHVMVEKPLAVSTAHAKRMAELVNEHKIHLLTNYETTWYDSNYEAYCMVREGKIGDIIRINVYDGHQGPFEIGCSKEFTDWLTDPKLNGGGAVMDFGCYGANLATWLLKGEEPISVYAILNQQKPALYPEVDDDATIIVHYRDLTVQIMASWNWPINRKDMHIYGQKGYVYQDNATNLRVFSDTKEVKLKAPPLDTLLNDPFRYLKAVVRNQIPVNSMDLSSLDNNLLVVSILEAAKRSAESGDVVYF